MYIIQNEYGSDLEWTNKLNAVRRHCRIGRVFHKSPFRVPTPMPPLDLLRHLQRMKSSPIFPDPCVQCVGKICGNVACPKRTVVTC